MGERPGEAEFELVADQLGQMGDALAVAPDGRRVHVRGALPGERVRVRVVRSTPSYDVGELLAVVEPSEARRQPPCPNVALGCGGCQWQHLGPEAQLAAKSQIVESALTRAGLVLPAETSTVALGPWAYRTSIRAEVRNGRPRFFAQRSTTTVPASGCLVAHPLLDDLLAHDYPGADHVVLRCGARTGERMAWVVPADAARFAPKDARRSFIHELAAGRRWRISARSFFQARPDGVDALVEVVRSAASEIGEPRTFVDLYAGVGVFAGALADDGWSGTAVEGSASSVRDARENLAGTDVVVVHDDVGRYEAGEVALAVADPSRAGLGPKGARTVLRSGAQRVVLVSCDAKALAADAKRLAAGGYHLQSLTLVDLFPQTFHIEAVSVFDRRA